MEEQKQVPLASGPVVVGVGVQMEPRKQIVSDVALIGAIALLITKSAARMSTLGNVANEKVAPKRHHPLGHVTLPFTSTAFATASAEHGTLIAMTQHMKSTTALLQTTYA